jgi:hypothetical protein|tara:strand:- start:430 stop:684 length:255 start_codon:yes stop_codon:yes gene_type:complete
MSTDFYKQQIEKTKARIEAYQDAELALLTDGISSYTLDTGQTRQTVTTNDLDMISKTIDRLLSQLEVYETRVYGTGTRTTRPAW